MTGLTGIAALVAGAAAGWGTWLILARPARLSLRATRTRAARAGRRRAEISTHWLSLSGLPLTPAQLGWCNWGAAVLAALVAFAVLHSPLAALALGYLASGLPESYVRQRARAQWQRLDQTALIATTNLRYWLETGTSVLSALRAIAARTDEPFRGWILSCLRAEAGQVESERVEDVMRARAQGIRHVELMLLADLLAVERRRGPTTDSLDELVDQWLLRIRADATRRGTISGGMLLSRHMITICVGVLLVMGLTHPAVVSSPAGVIVYGIGVSLVAGAAYVQRGVVRQAEAI